MGVKSSSVITSHTVTQAVLSRAPQEARIRTLAEVVDVVRAAGLPERRRQELVAALNTVARALGVPLAQIPAEPVLLRRRLAEATPSAYGVTNRRWNNVRSLTRAAVALAVPIAPSRSSADLTPAWRALRLLLRDVFTDPRRYADLSRLMHFCSARGIAPGAVDQHVFEDFRVALMSSLRKRPEETYVNACRTWNKVGTAIPEWPSFRTVRETRRVTWTLPWSRFSEALQRDVQAWLDRLAGRDLMADAPFRPLRPASLEARERQLRTAASALVQQGRDPVAITALGDLVDLENFKMIVRYLIGRRGGQVGGQVSDIASMLRSVARHHVKAPAATLDAMAAIIRRIQRPDVGLTPTNRRRLKVFDDPSNTQALLQLPNRLVREATRSGRSAKAAWLVQSAVAIELLLMAPMRLANLAMLDTDVHIARTRQSGEIAIVIEAHDVKNSVPLDYPLPASSATMLEVYLHDYRPLISPPGSTALFPGRGGKPKSRSMLRQQISNSIRAYTGLTVNPHLFRHITAKLYLDQHPGGYEVVRRVLNHRSMKTTTSFYTGLEAASAVRHFDQSILQLRKGGLQG